MKSLKLNIILIAVIALASSCSVYRTGQTPDDVYYSPGRENAAYVAVDNRNSNRYNAYDDYLPSEDRYLRMMVRNRTRWSVFNDYNYMSPWSYSPYSALSPYSAFGYSPFYSPHSYMGMGYINPYGYGYNGFYNSYWSWNSFYNPYYSSGIVYNPKTNPAGYTMLRSFNLNSYKNPNYNSNINAGKTYYRGLNTPRNTTPNATLGNSVRRIFSGETPKSGNQGSGRSNYYSPSENRPVRTYRPSTYNNNSSNNNTRSNSSGVIRGGSSSGSSSNSGGGAVTPGSRPSRR